MIRREFHSLGEFGDFLEKSVAIHEEAMAAVSAASAVVLQDKAKSIFGDKSKLAPLAQATQDERSALGYTPDEPLLRDGSLLRDSVEKAHSPDMAAIGSSEPIMLYHEMGYMNAQTGTPVPPRPVFKIALIESAEDVQEMLGEAIALTLGATSAPTLKIIP